MNAKTIKSFLALLLAAAIVGGVVYGIALLVGCTPESALNFGAIAIVVGLLEKPVLWVMRRFNLVKKKV